jgi:DNA-binding IclR family transcriptional regulator
MPPKRAGKPPPLPARPTLPARPAPPARDEPHGDDRQFVTALARGLEIMSCFSPAKPEIGGTQLAAMTGLPQPTVWRLCHTMMQLGYLVPVSGDKLRPGIPVLKLGRAALASIPFAEGARKGMQALADRFGSASGLGARDGGRMVFVQRCLSEAQLVMNLRIGARLPLVTSGVGWGLLAGFGESEREALITQYAVPDPRWPKVEPMFRRAMEEFGRRGYILNIGVFHQGYNTAAVPIMGLDGKPAFAISCAGSAATHSPAFLRREIAPALLKLVEALQRDLLAAEAACRAR